jgi:hypothetical protein
VLKHAANERRLAGGIDVDRAGVDRGFDRRRAPPKERTDRRDQHVSVLHERPHRFGARDIRDTGLEAPKVVGEPLQSLR